MAELLRKGVEWRALLDADEAVDQADIACWDGISRARVTQLIRMLRLVPETQ